MSRARHESHVHVVAPSVAHAAERLAWAWGQECREAWALDHQATRSLAELNHERVQLARSIPPDRSGELADAKRRLSLAEQDRRDLRQGTGRWAGTPAGHAAQALSSAAVDYQQASEVAQHKSLGRWAGRKAGARCGKPASASTKRERRGRRSASHTSVLWSPTTNEWKPTWPAWSRPSKHGPSSWPRTPPRSSGWRS